MHNSFSEFKFYQSFRIPVEEADDLRFLVQMDDAKGVESYIDDAKLIDISVTGFGFSTAMRISKGAELTISLQFKKHHLDLTGRVVRAFTKSINDERIIYGVEIDEEKSIVKFLESYVMSFSSDRLKDCLIEAALRERYTSAVEGFEMFSLLLTLFKDITHFGDKSGFIETMLNEVVNILNAQRASVFLINPETNELEAVCALGVDKTQLKFDYRLGIAGSVFTTGVALNIDTIHDSTRFNEAFDKKLGFETKSIICYPIYNREEKIIGVIEVLNKRNEDRFTVEDEKTMKVLSLIFSSVYHNYNPMSEQSMVRRFSGPFDRKHALVGKVPHMGSLRSSITKLKDIETPVLICGEKGVGKSLYAQILHHEGQRGLKKFEVVNCEEKEMNKLQSALFSASEAENKLIMCQGGTIVLHQVNELPLAYQKSLMEMINSKIIPGTKFSPDCRFLATSTEDLGVKVDKGEFDRDLYLYFSKAIVYVEPLRRRMDDLEALLDYFLKIECKKQGLLLKSFAPKVVDKMKTYDWPGNIAELKKCVERAVLYNPKSHVITEFNMSDSATPMIDVSIKKRMFGDLPFVHDHLIPLKDRLAIVEREMILSEIKRNNNNKSKAAKEMGISREALRKKLLLSSEVLKGLNMTDEQRKQIEKEDEEILKAA